MDTIEGGWHETSLYVADVKVNSFPSKDNLKEGIWEYLRKNVDTSKITFVENTKQVVFNETLIGFRIREIPEDKKILLSFFPYGEEISLWRKEKNLKVINDILKFCNFIGEMISPITEIGFINFQRIKINPEDIIDVGNWAVSFPLSSPEEKYTITELLSNISETKYQWIFEKLPNDNKFLIFSESYKGKTDTPIILLTKILNEFGKCDTVRSLLTSMSFCEKYHTTGNEVFIFVDNEDLLRKWYKTQKVYFDSNKKPSQFISDRTIREKLINIPGVKANFLLEILTKMGKKPLAPRPPEKLLDTDGFLCLSDIESSTRNLFGALFIYSKEGTEKDEEVHIYKDIEFEINEEEIIIPKKSLNLLVENISNLIGRKIKIDILLTKEWKNENLKELVSKLKEKEVEVNRIYYVSTRASRFVDSFVLQNQTKTLHPFVIISNKVAFVRSSPEIRTYANLSQIFIKLMWPNEVNINKEDIEKILWLVKKRIYRIQEFGVIKVPEPIHIFKSIRKMYLGEIKERLSLPLRLLI